MLLISGTYERRKKACHCLITEMVSVLGGIKARKMYVDKQRLEAQVFKMDCCFAPCIWFL